MLFRSLSGPFSLQRAMVAVHQCTMLHRACQCSDPVGGGKPADTTKFYKLLEAAKTSPESRTSQLSLLSLLSLLVLSSLSSLMLVVIVIVIFICDGCQKILYYIFVLRSYRYFARVPQGSRKFPARFPQEKPQAI